LSCVLTLSCPREADVLSLTKLGSHLRLVVLLMGAVRPARFLSMQICRANSHIYDLIISSAGWLGHTKHQRIGRIGIKLTFRSSLDIIPRFELDLGFPEEE
jgi:hypothetical protein